MRAERRADIFQWHRRACRDVGRVAKMAGARRCSRRAPSTYQPACKPGSVGRGMHKTRVNALLLAARDGHSSGTPVTRRLQQPTRTTGPRHRSRNLRRAPSLFGLAPGGVCRAASVAGSAVRSYRTVSPLRLPRGRSRFAFCGTFPGLRYACTQLLPPDVIRHRMSMEPGLSSRAAFRHWYERPSGRLTPSM